MRPTGVVGEVGCVRGEKSASISPVRRPPSWLYLQSKDELREKGCETIKVKEDQRMWCCDRGRMVELQIVRAGQ